MGCFMKVNEKMIGTERCVLKRKDESKVVIERKDLGEQYTYIVKLPIDRLKISRYDKVIDRTYFNIFNGGSSFWGWCNTFSYFNY